MAALYEFTEEVTKWIKQAEEEEEEDDDGTDTDKCNDDDKTSGQRLQCLTKVNIFPVLQIFNCLGKAETGKPKGRVDGRAARLGRKQELDKEEALLGAKKERVELETEITANKPSIIKVYMKPHTLVVLNGYDELIWLKTLLMTTMV